MVAFQPLALSCFTMKWDMMNQFLPCRYFISECLHHHIFPLWCPYINFGYPFYADPQSGLFYPITWLIALTSGYTVYSIGIEYVLHVTIAGLAFFLLLKSFDLDNYTATVFGVVYCLSGVFISNAQHLPWIITLAWLPLILLNFKNIFERPGPPGALALALFLYLGITGGYPGFFIILFYFFVLYTLVKIAGNINSPSGILKVLSLLLLAGFVFVVLAGGYLLSFGHSLSFIARGKAVSLTEANNVALTPRSMISFLFPFATACSAFRLETDISMSNIYCGFLLLPLLFIAFVKTPLQFFHRAIFVFAVLCLLAAGGKYFFVRTWLYNFLPGMNMLRHAAIFRVFTMFGFIFIAANGFGWIIYAKRTKSDSRFLKTIFAIYFLLLFAVFSVVLAKAGFNLSLPGLFNTYSITDFNLHQNVYAHIITQGIIQLSLLLAFTAILFLQFIPSKARVFLLGFIVIAEIFISVQLNLPATVVSDVCPETLQAKLNKLSTGYPVPPLSPMYNFTHYSDGSTLPIWYNLSFFKKIPAKDGFNSFYLQNVDDLNASGKRDSFLKLPVVFFKNADTKFEVEKFEPGKVIVYCQLNRADTIHLQQNFYEGWKVIVDSSQRVPDHQFCSMSAALPSGNHMVCFTYGQQWVPYLFLLSMITMVLLAFYLLIPRKTEMLS